MISYQGNILDYFPGKANPRPSQVEALEKIQEVLKTDTKFILAQLSTGVGKSHIGATLAALSPSPDPEFVKLVDQQEILARSSEDGFVYEDFVKGLPPFSCYVLTTTKNLQDQYNTLFTDSNILKGKKNYQCTQDPDFDCELGPCNTDPNLQNTCIKSGLCPYYESQRIAFREKFAVLSYSKFFQLPDFMRKRAIIVCDEASELEDTLVDQFSLTIEYGKLAKENVNPKKLIKDDQDSIRAWLTDLSCILKIKVKVLRDRIFKNKAKRSLQIVTTMKLKYLVRLLDSVNLVLDNWDLAEYLVEKDADHVSLVPLYVDRLSAHIFDHAQHVIFLSATIIDHKTFAKSLGVRPYKYIEIPSVFDPAKSPIYCPGKYSLNYQSIGKNLPKVVDQAIKICDFYKGKCGIIHTHTFKIAQAIQKKVGLNRRYLFREPGITNERIMEEHVSRNDGTVLVSPSLGYGTNLIDELGRFQIVIKLPYLPLQSKRIKILSEKSYSWYNMKMLTSLVQMSGRCTRSDTDHSETYILDGSAFSVLKRNWSILPLDFKNRLR